MFAFAPVFTETRPPRRFVRFAKSKFVWVSVQNYRFVRSRLASNRLASLKFEFSKSPSRMSAFCSRALLKLQSFATTLSKSTDCIVAPIKVHLLMLAPLKHALLRLQSLKLHPIRTA